MVKSDGLLLPLNILVVTSSVTDNPGCGIGRGRGIGRLLSFLIGVFFVVGTCSSSLSLQKLEQAE